MASMIEFWDYLLQFVVSAIGCVMALVLYAKMRRQPYFLLACFFGTYSLGTLYWTLHVLLLGTTPQVFYVSELGWIASYVFLLTIELTLPSDEEKNFARNFVGSARFSACLSLSCTSHTVMYFLIFSCA